MTVPAATVAPPARRVARNTALRAAAEVLGKLATLALTVVMLHELGPGAVGDFGFALAVSQLYWPIAGFGLDRLLLRDVARDASRAGVLVPQLNAFKLLVGLLCTVAGTAIVAAMQRGDDVTLAVFVLGLTLVATLVGATAQSVFLAHERTQDYFVAALPVKVFAALLGIAVLAAGGGIVAVATTNLVAALVGVAIGWAILGRRYGGRPAALGGTPRAWAGLARRSGPWGVQEVFGQITFRVGIIAVFVYAGSAAAGEYRAAYQLLEATLFLPWSIGTSVLPLISRARPGAPTGGEPPLETVTRASLEVVVALMLPVALLLGFCAEPLVQLLYDDEVPGAAVALPYLAVACVLYGAGHIAGLVALSHLPGRRTVQITAISALFATVAVVLLVPGEEVRGAAVAALATEAVLAGLSLWLAARVTGAGVLAGLASLPLIAGALMAAVLVATGGALVASVLLGGGAYLAALLALEARRRGPAWDLLRSLVPGRRRARAA